MSRSEGFEVLGKPMVRLDAWDKLSGRLKFTGDMKVHGMLYAKVVRSKIPHGVLKGVSDSEALGIPGVIAVYTAEDIPGENQVGYAVEDQPLLAYKRVRFIGDPVAIVVAESRRSAWLACQHVEVDVDPLPAVFTVEDALKPDAPKIHPHGNVAETSRIRKGDVDEAFSRAYVTVENVYRLEHQEHVYLETEAALAIPESGRITVIGGMQSPFLVRRMISRVLGLEESRIRIIQAPTGGAFGGKDDMGPLVCGKAAVAAYNIGRPVLLVYNREESIVSSNKRHPAIIRYASAVDRNGKLLGVKVDITMDVGAYANRGPYVLWRATFHSAGPYHVPNVWVDGRAVYTNKVFSGSFRGFGDPQIHFAAESQMDILAQKLGMDPLEFRLKNALRPGQDTTCGQVLDHSVGIVEALTRIREASGWDKLRRLHGRDKGRYRRGVGVACAYHGISTSKGVPDYSAASVIVNRDATVLYRSGICMLGQGSLTGHAKIVAEILGIPLDWIRISERDTDSVPDSRPTHGSRGLMAGGTAAADAAWKVRRKLEKVARKILGVNGAIRFRNGIVYAEDSPEKAVSFRKVVEEAYRLGIIPAAYGFYHLPERYFDPETGLGKAYACYTFIVNVVELQVDTLTGEVRVLRVWSAADVGKAIDPLLIRGQIEGAIVQGIGYALMERLVLREGQILNPNLTDYTIPVATDTPEIMEPIIVEDEYRNSAFGAKGVAEAALIPTPPAIANAINYATDIRLKEIPMTREKILKYLEGEES